MANDAVEEAEEDAELEEVQEVEEEVEEAKPAKKHGGKKHGGKKHYGGKKTKSPPKALFTLTSTNSMVARSTMEARNPNLHQRPFSPSPQPTAMGKTQRNRQPSPVRVTRSSSVTTTGRLPKNDSMRKCVDAELQWTTSM